MEYSNFARVIRNGRNNVEDFGKSIFCGTDTNTFTDPFGGARMHQPDELQNSAGSQHKVECGSPAVRGASNFEQQVAAKQNIDRIV